MCCGAREREFFTIVALGESELYLKSVSSSAMTIHSTLFSVEFLMISSSTRRRIFRLFSQWPRSVLGICVEMVGMASSRTSLKILKWIVNCAQERRIIGKRSLWYFSQVFTANKTLSSLNGLPWRESNNNLSQLYDFTTLRKELCRLHRRCPRPSRKWHIRARGGRTSKALASSWWSCPRSKWTARARGQRRWRSPWLACRTAVIAQPVWWIMNEKSERVKNRKSISEPVQMDGEVSSSRVHSESTRVAVWWITDLWRSGTENATPART